MWSGKSAWRNDIFNHHFVSQSVDNIQLDFIVYAADKKEIVVTQGTPCNKLYVLLEGKLRTDIGFSRDTVQMLQLPAMQRKLCNTCGSWLITLNVESRFIVYLFEHKKKDSLIVEITHTQSQLAEYLNVSRP